MKEKATIELTKVEADELLKIISMAVKANGLENNVARNAIYFEDKIANGFKEDKKEG